MRKVLFACSILMLFAASVSAQKSKPWTEWTQKESEKVLNDSAWGQTQTEGNSGSQPDSMSAITQTTAAKESQVKNAGAAANVESGEKKDAMVVRYHVRLLSAKPIRAAFVRLIEIQGAPPEKVAQWRGFVDRDFGDYIVVTITMDGSTDRKRVGMIMTEIGNVDAEALKGTTYLERKDGKRVALMEYRAPTDVLGAKFVFPRMLEGKPFIAADSGEVRFSTEAGKVLKINKRFKVSEMVYDGKLEY